MYFYGHAPNWSIVVTRKAGWSVYTLPTIGNAWWRTDFFSYYRNAIVWTKKQVWKWLSFGEDEFSSFSFFLVAAADQFNLLQTFNADWLALFSINSHMQHQHLIPYEGNPIDQCKNDITTTHIADNVAIFIPWIITLTAIIGSCYGFPLTFLGLSYQLHKHSTYLVFWVITHHCS